MKTKITFIHCGICGAIVGTEEYDKETYHEYADQHLDWHRKLQASCMGFGGLFGGL